MNTEFMTKAQVMSAAPSVFGSSPKSGLSEKYGFVPTHSIIEAMIKEGFQPMAASQTRSRKTWNSFYAKHMVRFRHENSVGKGEFPEVVLINSHDGSCAFKLMAGYFRLVCSNGLIVGNMLNNIVVRHVGDIADGVIEGSYKILSDIRENEGKIDLYKSIQLSDADQLRFADEASKLRWGDNAPFGGHRLLGVRRMEDYSDDLWTVFNRIQENVVRGGIRGTSANNRRFTTRTIRSIDENVRINRELWNLADSFAQAA